ncbi:hypothetical protein [Pollutibacter soli]|uniref:hypothetical protein n=1 Tax=Pollutibacter soli TaxID=3034157 RepID=UPI00301383F9
MRKIILLLSTISFITVSCHKDDLIQNVSSYSIGSYLNLVETENLLLDATNAAASTVAIKVKPVGSELQKVNIYAVAGGPDPDESNWKLVKEVSATDSLFTLAVTGAELAAALGIPITDIQPGQQYTFYNQMVTADGRVFDISNTEDDIEGQPAFNSVFNWTATVVCPYTNNMTGEFTIAVDQWDGNVGGKIEVAAGPGENEITLKTPFPLSIDAKDLIVSIDPVTGFASVAKQVYGSYPGAPDISAQTTGSNNFVFSCKETLDITLNHSSALGNFGNFRYVLVR